MERLGWFQLNKSVFLEVKIHAYRFNEVDSVTFHVTNLNIAQVKQKHGIIERENYNKPKSEDSKQPGCPEEKVEAIEDALRYYQMI